ncbi:molybdenum cofactor guanylyltransferase [Corynebacterium lizhenjunii]|uniref:molybdenum cofactor guanylyltransferase n=1 Tax=Corynebacterium lizhenjunii TaxID=2709394 RepID=UPI0013E9D107|nr:NTP transferase domain-containing protein [Corynebacterium lizhenjunii]
MLGVIVLAGGRNTRMKGTDKAAITVGGERFIDRLYRQLPAHALPIAVTPRDIGHPRVCEQPPFGGPVAGIAAGAAYLARHPEVSTIAVLSADAPDSPRTLPALQAALDAAGCSADVAVCAEAEHLHPLCALWHAAALHCALQQLGDPRDVSAKRLLSLARGQVVVPDCDFARDYDTPTDVAAYSARLSLL